jgi:hypothetical protein
MLAQTEGLPSLKAFTATVQRLKTIVAVEAESSPPLNGIKKPAYVAETEISTYPRVTPCIITYSFRSNEVIEEPACGSLLVGVSVTSE